MAKWFALTKKKIDKKVTTPRKLTEAINMVRAGQSVRGVAKSKNICRQTLSRAVKRCQDAQQITAASDLVQLAYGIKPIFNKEIEEEIKNYCMDLARMGFGLTVEKVKELAYETAARNGIQMPDSWVETKQAGRDWFKCFLKRHPDLSIRKPEGCSIARAAAFNPTTIENFYDKLHDVLGRHPNFKNGSRVANLDETRTLTVQNSRKIVSPKGVKQLHQTKTAERGTGVTTCCIIGAHGIALPPVMIYPRKYFKDSMLINAFPGTLGLANPSGYMTSATFLNVLEHVKKCFCSSKEDPLLLFVDGFGSHLTGAAIDYCRDNGITLFSFPPHCTHKLQPLDIGIFGSFKAYYDKAINSWIWSNPGSSITIYHIAGFVNDAWSKSATPVNIIASFKKPGICPFDRDVFQTSDFIMSKVTARPDPNADMEVGVSNDSENEDDPQSENSEPESGPSQPPSKTPTSSKVSVSPVELIGLPQKKPQVAARKPRRKGKCMIATDTPEKEEIQAREKAALDLKLQKEERKRKREESKKKREEDKKKKQEDKKKKQAAKEKKKREQSKKKKETKRLKHVPKVLFVSSSENESSGSEMDVSDNDDDAEVVNGNGRDFMKAPTSDKDPLNPLEGDYVLVKFSGKEDMHYVGSVLKERDCDGDLEISFLRLAHGNKFLLPNVPDIHSVHINDVKCVLSKPSIPNYGTKRQQAAMVFNFDFSGIRLR